MEENCREVKRNAKCKAFGQARLELNEMRVTQKRRQTGGDETT